MRRISLKRLSLSLLLSFVLLIGVSIGAVSKDKVIVYTAT